MTRLSDTDEALIATARDLAHDTCRGHAIDEAPAMLHALKVSNMIREEIPDAPAWLIAAALLHDYPEFAPNTHVARILTEHVGEEGCAAILAIHQLHIDLNTGAKPVIDTSSSAFLHLFAADQVVALDSLLLRAQRSGDTRAFIAQRRALINLLSWFRKTQQRIAPHLPEKLASRHAKLLSNLHHAADK